MSLCNGFVVIASLQWFSFFSFTDVYKQSNHCKLSHYFDLGQYFPIHIEKTLFKKSFLKKSMPGLCLWFQYSYQTFWAFWIHDLQSLHRQNLVVLISSLYFSKLVKTSHFLVLQAVRASFYVRYRLCPNKCHSHDSWEKMGKTP